jgi:hypothetical protein
MKLAVLALTSLLLAGEIGAHETAETPEKSREQEEQEEQPFEEPIDHLDLGLLFDFRFAATDRTLGFLDRGLGKVRYGGDENGERRALARLAQLSFVADARFIESLGAHVHVNFDAEPDRGDAGDRVDLIEAFLRYQFSVGEWNELRGKVGLFFPPISLEHPGEAWTTLYSITPSAINAWVGEEVRALGAELTYARVGLENEVSFTAAAFGWNDASGSLLAYRGWAIHDRQTGFRDHIPLPPNPAIRPGGMFQSQASWAEPILEVDDRAGWFGAFSWDKYRKLLVNGIYYDNRANPMAFRSGQYGWHTKFYDVGVLYSMRDGSDGPELLGQFLAGDSWMGNLAPDLPKVNFDYRAGYVLFTVPFGRQRVTFRYDRFKTVDLDEFADIDNNDESGNAVTFAYLLRTASKQRLALELLRVRSDRLGRAAIGLPTEATEWLFQVSYRLGF